MSANPAPGRVLFYVQHLMGVGHVFRATRIVKAMVAQGLQVDLVLGGQPVPGLAAHGARIHQLPPVRAGEVIFNELVGADGEPVDEAWKAARRDRLLAIFRDIEPDIVVTEAFPFGRRPMRFELLPLVEAARARARPPVIVSSVRDILQENARPERDRETVNLIASFFDHVLVHGDPGFARLDVTFPPAGEIASKLVYTGIVAPEAPVTSAHGETFDVVVSVGGGALGHTLLMTAAEARKRSVLRDARWCIIAGVHRPAAQRAELAKLAGGNVVIREFSLDFPALLAGARLSISRAGYNTVADICVAGCRSVVIPLSDGVETEQIRRAELLDARGYAVALAPRDETPDALADAIDRAMARDSPDRSGLRLDGAETAARMLAALARGERPQS